MSLTSGSEGRRGNRWAQESAAFLSGERKKGVDEAKRILHNLVSLLLTQQRRKKPVVEQLFERNCAATSRSIFKNLQPISVGA
ncbi:hypothetical protein AB4Y45_16415 [Paraburkholderia sp. EG287A]|uniref:hypothetical protein n=1 Tax=unclassified Paraburkholderia TaxID=2615204 RepID=UPI0034D37B04